MLRLHAVLVGCSLGNLEGGEDGGDVVFGDAQRAAVEHVIDRADDGPVDAVGGDIDRGRPLAMSLICAESPEFAEPFAGVTPALNCTRS